ncbi:hypothetical protein C7C46_16560 [Streptomyces tateyamensis]|uniref:Uncharacterized protein n=1 Tax=Streptomyces tateyamensis TaxID=565073 RepID=A0A2V4N2Z6_9ACTN|nr:hypothetical protein [Streptomyces tateyamensis]PYC78246.1 hypothetical protein C7C46_16560 [Streptomyces tateyamensis]
MDEERFMRGRVYGADHEDPDPGPRAGRSYRVLVAGPLDGLLLDVTDWSPQTLTEGAALATEIGRFGPGGHTRYGPGPTPDGQRWFWEGDVR